MRFFLLLLLCPYLSRYSRVLLSSFFKNFIKDFFKNKSPTFVCIYVIWKMHFNHWWVNKVLWWRPNMVIVKIKKKKLSDLGLRLLLCIIELSSFYFDWIVFWQRTKKNWSLKKNSICWNHPYKHRYICYKYSSPLVKQ